MAQLRIHLLRHRVVLLILLMLVVLLCNLSLIHFLIFKQIEFIITQYLLCACILSINVGFDLVLLKARSVEVRLRNWDDELVILRQQLLGVLLRRHQGHVICLDVQIFSEVHGGRLLLPQISLFI